MINSTFTFHLIAIIITSMLIEIFTYYGILWAFLNKTENFTLSVIQNGSWAMTMILVKLAVTYIGSSVNNNGEETAVIITRILSETHLSSELEYSLQNIMLRISKRNYKLQTPLFNINCKLLVSVSTYRFMLLMNVSIKVFTDLFYYYDLSCYYGSVGNFKNSVELCYQYYQIFIINFEDNKFLVYVFMDL